MQNKSTNVICLIVQDGSNRSQCVLCKLSIKIEVIWGDGLKIRIYDEKGHKSLHATLQNSLTLIGKTGKFIQELFRNFSFTGHEPDRFSENSSNIFSKFQFSNHGLHRCWWRMLETKCVGDKSRYMYVLSHMFMIKFYGKIFYLPYLVLNSLFWMSVWEIGHCYGDIKLCPNILKSAMRWVIIIGICQWGINRSTRLFPELHFNGSAAVAEFLLINRLIEFHFNNHWR